MLSVLPKIEIINCERPYVYGVSIDAPGKPSPLFVVPFRGVSVKFGAPLGPARVLLVGQDHHQTFLAVVDATTGEIVRRAEHSATSEHYVLSADRRRLFGYGHLRSLSIFDTDSLAMVGSFNAALWDSEQGRLIHTRDYYWIDNSIRQGSAVRFHSEELKREFAAFGKGLQFGPCIAEQPNGEILIGLCHEEMPPPQGRPSRWEHGVYAMDVAGRLVR